MKPPLLLSIFLSSKTDLYINMYKYRYNDIFSFPLLFYLLFELTSSFVINYVTSRHVIFRYYSYSGGKGYARYNRVYSRAKNHYPALYNHMFDWLNTDQFKVYKNSPSGCKFEKNNELLKSILPLLKICWHVHWRSRTAKFATQLKITSLVFSTLSTLILSFRLREHKTAVKKQLYFES